MCRSRRRSTPASCCGAPSARSLLLAGAIGGLYAVYDYARPGQRRCRCRKAFPQPRVVTHAADIAELHGAFAAAEASGSNTWGWANDQHTLVQIPIDRAMKLMAQKGGNAYAPLLPPQGALTSPTAARRMRSRPQRRRLQVTRRRSSSHDLRALYRRHLCKRALCCGADGRHRPRANFTSAQLAAISASPPPHAALPLALSLKMRTAAPRRSANAIDGVPAVVIFADYTCRTLCGPIVEFTAAGLAKTGLRPGVDYRLVVIGINPRDGIDTARAMRAAHIDPNNAVGQRRGFPQRARF